MLSKFLFFWSFALVVMRSLGSEQKETAKTEIRSDLGMGPELRVEGGIGTFDLTYRDADGNGIAPKSATCTNGVATILVPFEDIGKGFSYQVWIESWVNVFNVPSGIVYYKPTGAAYTVLEPQLIIPADPGVHELIIVDFVTGVVKTVRINVVNDVEPQ